MCTDHEILHLMKLVGALREQDILIHWICLDCTQSRHDNG